MSSFIHFIFAASTSTSLVLLFTLWKFRHRNPKGYLQIGVLIVSFSLIIIEQWVIKSVPETWPYVSRTTTWMPFFFGPCFWLFSLSLDKPERLSAKYVSLHYLPAFLCLLFYLPYLLLPAEQKIALRSFATPTSTLVFANLKIISWICYLTASFRYIHTLNTRLHDPLTSWFVLLMKFVSYAAVLVAIAFFAEARWGELWLPSDVFAALTLSVTVYLSAFLAITNWSAFAKTLNPSRQANEQTTVTTDRSTKLLEDDETQLVYQAISEKMSNHNWYLQPSLKSEQLAELLNLPVHYLSYVVNAQFNDNIQNWLNHFRVEYVKNELAANPDLSILDVALEAGFNSKATFNRVFKRFTNMTPSQFKDLIINKIS